MYCVTSTSISQTVFLSHEATNVVDTYIYIYKQRS